MADAAVLPSPQGSAGAGMLQGRGPPPGPSAALQAMSARCRAPGSGLLRVRLTSEPCPWEMPSPAAPPASPVKFGSRHGETFGAAQLQRTP